MDGHKDHCQICQFVIEKIESCIEEQAEDINEHIDEIIASMQRVCDSHILNFIFGQDFTDECNNILEELPEIIDHWMNLNETFSPEFVCGNLGLCNNSTMFWFEHFVYQGKICTRLEFIWEIDAKLGVAKRQAPRQDVAAFCKLLEFFPIKIIFWLFHLLKN